MTLTTPPHPQLLSRRFFWTSLPILLITFLLAIVTVYVTSRLLLFLALSGVVQVLCCACGLPSWLRRSRASEARCVLQVLWAGARATLPGASLSAAVMNGVMCFLYMA